MAYAMYNESQHGILVNLVHRPLHIHRLQYKMMNAQKPRNEANRSPAHEWLHPISLISRPFYFVVVENIGCDIWDWPGNETTYISLVVL